MPTQYPFGSANDYYKKKLFVDVGMQYIEVKARIVEPYSAPTPTVRNRELEVINAPSGFNSVGISSYKISLTLLFATKEDFAEYMMWIGWTHKFYDERGQIYLGAVESVSPKPVFTANAAGNANGREDRRGYMVDVTISAIKKDLYDRQDRFKFQDLVDAEQQPLWYTEDIREMANLGIIATSNNDGSPVLYFRPNDNITRAEFTVMMNRTRRLLERTIRE